MIDFNGMILDMDKILDEVIGTKEASELLGISQGYLRQLIIKGTEFKKWEYKKVGNATIFLKESILSRKGKFKEYKKDSSLTPYEEDNATKIISEANRCR